MKTLYGCLPCYLSANPRPPAFSRSLFPYLLCSRDLSDNAITSTAVFQNQSFSILTSLYVAS